MGAEVVGRALKRRVPQLGEGKIYGSASAFCTLYTFYTVMTAAEERQ